MLSQNERRLVRLNDCPVAEHKLQASKQPTNSQLMPHVRQGWDREMDSLFIRVYLSSTKNSRQGWAQPCLYLEKRKRSGET